MNPLGLAQPVAADIAALDAAATLAEEALGHHREALILLAEGWQSETGSAITDFMNLQCVHATDVVDALRRVAAGLPESRAASAGDDVPGHPVNHADAIPPLPGAVPSADPTGRLVPALPADPMGPTAPAPAPAPVPAPDPVSPWAPGTAAAWNTPSAADTPWAAPGGPAASAAPALPDLGCTLVGLVAEIAQALGSYADTAPALPADDLGALAPDSRTDMATTPDPPPAQPVPPDHADAPTPPGATSDSGPATPASLAPTDPTAISAQPAAPAELLAAERPPEPEAAPAPAPVADTPVSAPAIPPAVSPPADAPPVAPAPAATPAEAEKTPCEIAADDLPKVGE